MRHSNNYYTPAGNLVDGFDYDLQVWVVGGIVQPCSHPETTRPCCNAAKYAGRAVVTIPGRGGRNEK